LEELEVGFIGGEAQGLSSSEKVGSVLFQARVKF